MACHCLLLTTVLSFTSLIVIIWEDWKVERLYAGEALVANGQPTVEHIKSESNEVATKRCSCIIAPKSSLSLEKMYFRSHAGV